MNRSMATQPVGFSVRCLTSSIALASRFPSGWGRGGGDARSQLTQGPQAPSSELGTG